MNSKHDCEVTRWLWRSALLVLCGTTSLADAAQVTNIWNGTSGNWNDPARWSAGVVPNNAADSYIVQIDNAKPAASIITFDPANASANTTIDALTIDANDKLTQSRGILNVGALTVNGTLAVSSTNVGDSAQLNVSGPLIINGTLTVNEVPYGVLPQNGLIVGGQLITGAGTLGISATSGSGVAATSGSLTIDSGITVEGRQFGMAVFVSGRIGTSTVPLINLGHIVALPGGGIRVVGSSITNQGILESKPGGLLSINPTSWNLASIGTLVNNGTVEIGGTFENAGQTLVANRQDEWAVAGTIHGGTLQSNGTGYFSVREFRTGTLDGVTMNGTMEVGGGRLNIVNGLGGSGTIYVGGFIDQEAYLDCPTIPAGITVSGGFLNTRISVTTNLGVLQLDGDIKFDNSTFTDRGSIVANGGSLQVSTLNLSNFDRLIVNKKFDGTPYNSYLIATYGTRTGTFDVVTPGIFVSYSANEIRISGTPIPEPAYALSIGGVMLVQFARRRRRTS